MISAFNDIRFQMVQTNNRVANFSIKLQIETCQFKHFN